MKKMASRELTLQQMQQLSLEILLDVHDWCIRHDVRYGLAYGTLLGAVRHQGFIPWDDDVDILMPRADYERFARSYDGKFRFVSQHNTPDCYLAFGRVCDTERTRLVTTSPWHGKSLQSGLFIDVFPIDAIPDDPEAFQQWYHLLDHLRAYTLKLRKAHAETAPGMSLKGKLKLWFRKRVHPNLLAQNPADFARDIRMVIGEIPAGEAHVGQLGIADNPREFFRKEWFDHFVPLPFEGHQLLAPEGYDALLTAMYGNYRVCPPPEECVPTQRTYNRFFWKD